MAMIKKISVTGYSIGWGAHAALEGLAPEAQLALVKKTVEKAISACGVSDIMQVIPSGWNKGVAGPLRNQRHNGIKYAYWAVYEMLNGWAQCQGDQLAADRKLVPYVGVELLSQTLYEAEKVLTTFAS
jgi:hypothetical protein